MNVDTALREREVAGRPIRVAMVGAGATGRAIALQLGTPVPGIRLVAIANRTPAHAERAYREAGIAQWTNVDTALDAESAIGKGKTVLTDDPSVLTRCDAIDMLVEVTGSIEPAARVTLDAFAHGKSVVLVNAELDSLVGPILKEKADKAGVVLTHTDGDEPGVAMTLLRYIRSLGLRPVAAGNIKGMVDYYRNPDTQRAFAEKNDQDVKKGHVVRGCDQAVHGDDGSFERDRVPRRPPRDVRSGMQATCGKSPTYYRLSRCSKPAWSTTRWARRRIRARSSSFTKNLR